MKDFNEQEIYLLNQELDELKAENIKLKNIIKEMEEDLDDWISDVSILYTYDDGKPNNLDELQCCMEHVHEEWSKYKRCLDEIEEVIKNFSCENCKEFSRCLEKRTQSINSLKVELSYLSPNIEEINKIMQMIPSPTRCDVALEKVILQKIKEV